MTENQLLSMFEAMAHPTRLRLLAIIATDKALPTNMLAKLCFTSPQNISAHIRSLEKAELIHTAQSGRYKYHQLNFPNLKFMANFILFGKVAPEDFMLYMEKKINETRRLPSTDSQDSSLRPAGGREDGLSNNPG